MRVRACVGGGSTEAAVELGLWVTTIGRQVGGGWTCGGFSRGGGGLRATGRVELPACVQCVIYGLAGRQPATVVAVVVVVRVRVVRVCARECVFKKICSEPFFLFFLFCLLPKVLRVLCKGRDSRNSLLTYTLHLYNINKYLLICYDSVEPGVRK